MKLKADVKVKWLRALRSGEYKQTTGTMYSTDADGTCSYCCLGVLESLRADENPDFSYELENEESEDMPRISTDLWAFSREELIRDMMTHYRDLHEYSNYEKEEKIRKASELIGELNHSSDFEADFFSTLNELAKMNDRGATFEQIADWIEEHM